MRFLVRKELGRDLLAVLLVAVCGAVVEICQMTLSFEPFDYSGFLDVFYRIYSGQKIYADFVFPAGPLHPYIGTFFFWLFGPGTRAVMANACALSLFMAAFSYSLARSQFGVLVSTALAALCTLYVVGPVAFPTYDHHAWIFIFATVVLLRRNYSKNAVLDASLRGFFCGLTLMLSFLAKSNIGAIGSLGAVAVLLLLPHAGRAIFWLVVAFVLGVNAVFLMLGTPFEFFNSNFIQYPAVGRLSKVGYLFSYLHDVPYFGVFLLALALVLFGGRDFLRREKRDLAILAGLLGTSVFSGWTSSMHPDLNGFGLGVEILLLLVLSKRLPPGRDQNAQARANRTMLAMVGVVACLTFVTGIEKTWQLAFYFDRLPHPRRTDYQIQSAPFKGWSCRRELCEDMDEAVRYLRANVPATDPLFVFPDMTLIYLLTDHESYRMAPYQFVLSQLPAPGKATIEFLNYFNEHPPQWVVLHDTSYMPSYGLDTPLQLKALMLDTYFEKYYARVWTRGKYSILKRR